MELRLLYMRERGKSFTRVWIPSVEVNSESNDSDEEILLDYTNSCDIISLFIPALSWSNLNALASPLTHDGLDTVLVPYIVIEISESLLRLVCQISHHLLIISLILGHIGLQPLIDDIQYGLSCLLHHHNCTQLDTHCVLLTSGLNFSLKSGYVWYVLTYCCPFLPLFIFNFKL